MTNEKAGPGTDSWFTPQWLIEWSHEYLGGPPDFDPASSFKANDRIGAECFDRLGLVDGLVKRTRDGWSEIAPDSWPADAKTVFMNQPFSKAREFWSRLWDWWCYTTPFGDSRFFAVMPANTNSSYFHDMIKKAHVWVPEKRVAFVDPRTGLEAKAPRGNVCVVTSHPPIIAPRQGMWIGQLR